MRLWGGWGASVVDLVLFPGAVAGGVCGVLSEGRGGGGRVGKCYWGHPDLRKVERIGSTVFLVKNGIGGDVHGRGCPVWRRRREVVLAAKPLQQWV